MPFLVAFLLALAAPAALSETFPSKPVRVVVPQPPGSPLELATRLVADQLRERFGQPFVVENRPGAGGGIAMEIVAKSPPDGYTLLASFDGPLVVSPNLFTGFPVDPVRDLRMVAIYGDGGASVLAVGPQIPVKTLADFVAYARARPGELSYASGGHGTNSNILSEVFKQQANLDIVHVPFKGPVAAATEVVAQRVAMYISPPSSVLRHLSAGSMRALAVAGANRSPLLPDVPTFAEAGYRTISPPSWWFAMLAPARTPAEVVDALNAELLRIVQTPKLREFLATQGLEPGTLPPAQAAAQLARDSAYWAEVIRAHRIRVE
jgi:tripartite-type tricarboxylate transporter receptor subunit TctC